MSYHERQGRFKIIFYTIETGVSLTYQQLTDMLKPMLEPCEIATRQEDPIRHILIRLLVQAPLFVPLLVVIGILMGGSVGWGLVTIALALPLSLRIFRVMALALLCGALTFAFQHLCHNSESEITKALSTNRVVSVEGTVVRLLSRGCIVETPWPGARVVLHGEMPWNIADRVSVLGGARSSRDALVDGMFSMPGWMKQQGVCADLTYIHGKKIGESWGWTRLVLWAGKVRSKLVERLMPPGVDDARAQVLCALLLGDKERADDDTIDIFRRSGCLHAFAVSGLHVGLIAGFFWIALRLLRVPPALGRYIQLTGVGVYVLATGLAVPALRAYLMLVVLMFALILRRRAFLFNTWCFAALLVLMIAPKQLFHPGFQLSFAVYGAICLASRYCMRGSAWFGPDAYIPRMILTRRERFVRRMDIAFRGIVVVSLSAWLVSLPLTLVHFHVINTTSYFTNILICPLLPVVMFMGILALLFSPLPWLGPVCHGLALKFSGLLISVVASTSAYSWMYRPVIKSSSTGSAMVVSSGYGKSFAILGNPGVLVGDVQREGDARFVVEPVLFHSGYSVAASFCAESDEAASWYAHCWPGMTMLLCSGNVGPRSFSSPAGQYTFYYSSTPRRGKCAELPLIIWQTPKGGRLIYIGNASASTFYSLPESERRADVVILGYNPHDPIMDVTDFLARGVSEIILLPSARGLHFENQQIFPTKPIQMSEDKMPLHQLSL